VRGHEICALSLCNQIFDSFYQIFASTYFSGSD